jgi:hypothetical protein
MDLAFDEWRYLRVRANGKQIGRNTWRYESESKEVIVMRLFCRDTEMTTRFNSRHLDAISKGSWCTRRDKNTFYARTRNSIGMHRMIAGLGDYDGVAQVDHLDGNGLNNVDDNIRIVDNRRNCNNQRRRKTNKTGINGVSILHHPTKPRVYASWMQGGKQVHQTFCFGGKRTLEEAMELAMKRRKLADEMNNCENGVRT